MNLLIHIQAGLFIFVAVNGSSSDGCPDGWLNLGSETCINLLPPVKNISWYEAQRKCDELDGYLPELHTSTLVGIFYDLMITYHDLFGTSISYLGASDQGHEGDWAWEFNGGVVDDYYWGEGSPSMEPHNQIDCMLMMTTEDSFTWNDVDCIKQSQNIEIAQLCMRSLETSTSTQRTTVETTTYTPTTQFTTSHTDSTAASTPTPTPSPTSCPPEYEFYGGHCYSYYDSFYNVVDAESICQEDGGHLTSIHSEEENEFVASLVSYSPKVWLGLHEENGTWIFTDGTAVDYSNWFTGHPNGDGTYVYMDTTHNRWVDTQDYHTNSFVCKISVKF